MEGIWFSNRIIQIIQEEYIWLAEEIFKRLLCRQNLLHSHKLSS